MKLKIKRLDPEAKLPTYAHDGDAGMDIYSLETYTLKPHERKGFKTGLSFEMDKEFVGLIWDKSGLAIKHGLKVMGGVLDSNYRGELILGILNTSEKEYTIEKGDKIAQLLIQRIETAQIEEVDELSDTDRGQGGLGSTGKK
jgi:dUTP pyrophosphatase